MKPHKYAELIKAWADGAKIQRFKVMRNAGAWIDADTPNWFEHLEYRIKPESERKIEDIEFTVKIVFSGSTGEPKSAEILK